jgi:hypothetical protein
MRTRTAPAIAAAAITLLAGTAASATPSPATGCTPRWKLVAVQNSSESALPTMAAPAVISRRDAWFPGYNQLTGTSSILHWDGHAIRAAAQIPQTTTLSPNVTVSSGSFDSSADGWVLGQYGASPQGPSQTLDQGFLAHWHAGRWTLTPPAVSPSPQATWPLPAAVAAISPSSAWTAGGYYTAGPDIVPGTEPAGALTEHWDGTQWTIVPNPASTQPGTELNALTVISPTDIWAVGRQAGTSGTSGTAVTPLIEHWDGTRWSVAPSPAANQPSALYAVSADSTRDAWAVGDQTKPGTSNVAVPLVEHWDGTTWKAVGNLPHLGNARLDSVYAAAPDSVWATIESPAGVNTFLNWNGTTWTTTAVPGPREYGLRHFYGGISGTGPDNVWAAGEVTNLTTETGTPQIAHLSCGRGQ